MERNSGQMERNSGQMEHNSGHMERNSGQMEHKTHLFRDFVQTCRKPNNFAAKGFIVTESIWGPSKKKLALRVASGSQGIAIWTQGRTFENKFCFQRFWGPLNVAQNIVNSWWTRHS